MKIPVIKGKIGNWIYYSGVMSFKQISENVKPSINEIYETKCLDELLQRDLTSNYESIKKYILQDCERFFNAIILAIYDGDPQWLEVEFNDSESEFTNVGFLQFNGKEIIFPVDGQHRVAGIIGALRENQSLDNEQVPVVFIAHQNTDDGKRKTRKLFSTLNRRAKPVGQNENIALDEDDVCSIITRDLVQNHDLFSNDRVINSLGKQIPVQNESAFTSLITLYQCVELIVKDFYRKHANKKTTFSEFKLYRPDDETINEYREHVYGVFDSFKNNTTVIKEYLTNTLPDKAKKYRNSSGGNLLFRPIVLTEYFFAADLLIERGIDTYDTAFSMLNNITSIISLSPWKGLLWDGKKIVTGCSKLVIRYLLIAMASGRDVLKSEESIKLATQYALSLGISENEAKQIIFPE